MSNENKSPFEGDKQEIIIKAAERMKIAFRKVLLDFKPDGHNDDLDSGLSEAFDRTKEIETHADV